VNSAWPVIVFFGFAITATVLWRLAMQPLGRARIESAAVARGWRVEFIAWAPFSAPGVPSGAEADRSAINQRTALDTRFQYVDTRSLPDAVLRDSFCLIAS